MEDTKYIYKKVDNNALTNNQHILLKEPIFGLSNNNDPAKDAFYNNISHELRTPLNVVLGSIQLFEMMGDDLFLSYNRSKFKAYNSLMKKNCFRLLRVINNLIDSSKLDTGNLSLCLKNHNIVKTIEDIFNNTKAYAKGKGLKMKLKSKTKKIITAYDEDKLARAILNLISNAIKFTPKGCICIEVKKKENRVYIAIKDTGIGIPSDKIDSIFDPFTQVDSSLTRSHEGSGLGLSIAKSIVELHNGQLSVISRLGKGSSFIIELPVKQINEDETQTTTGIDFTIDYEENIKIELSDIV
jgi:signal transduction histidine kinase